MSLQTELDFELLRDNPPITTAQFDADLKRFGYHGQAVALRLH